MGSKNSAELGTRNSVKKKQIFLSALRILNEKSKTYKQSCKD